MNNHLTGSNNQRIYLTITLLAMLGVLSCAPQSTKLGLDMQSGTAVRYSESAEETIDQSSLEETYPYIVQLLSTADEIQIQKKTKPQKSAAAQTYVVYKTYRQGSSKFVGLQEAFYKGAAGSNTSMRAPPEHLVVVRRDGSDQFSRHTTW